MRFSVPSERPRATFTVLALTAFLLVPTNLGAEEGPASAFSETLDVEVVNVEVYVTDRRGEPITGLAAEAFELYEDGQRVEVSNFYAVEGGRLAHQGLEAPPVLESDSPSRTLAPLPTDQRLHVVLFIDSQNIGPRQRNRVIRDLVPFVENEMQPGDRAMIVSHAAALQVVQGFTDDRDLLKAKLEELAAQSSLGAAAAQLERRMILDQITQAQLPVGREGLNEELSIALSEAQSILSSIELYAQRHQDQTFKTLEVLRQFVDSLAGIPGRKSVVYISEGLSLRPGESLFHAWHGKFSILRDAVGSGGGGGLASPRLVDQLNSVGLASSQFNLSFAFRELGHHASANRVTFYGLRPSDRFSTLSADVSGGDLGAMDSANRGQTQTAALESMDAANRGGGMWELADATGGFAITNASTFAVALDKLRRDFDAFYSIGYVSNRPRDEKKHRIEIRTSNRSHVLRYRRSFRDKSRNQRMNDRTLAALAYDAADNPLGVTVQMAAAQLDAEGHQRLPILVEVPVERLTLLPQEGHYEGRVSIHVGARDRFGRTSPIRSMEIPIRIPENVLAELVRSGRRFGHHFLLEMIPDQHRLAIGVRDEIADVESTTLVDQPVQNTDTQPAF